MKKLMTLMIFILPLVFFSGCGKEEGNNGNGTPSPQPQEFGSVEDYFPIKENTRYIYEGHGNEYASYDVYIDYAAPNKMQQRVDTGGTVIAKVIEIKDDRVAEVFSSGEVYYRENFLEKTGTEEILLMEPIKKGTTWTLDDSRVRTITGTSVDVKVPSGSYKAIEVTTEGPNDKIVDYYAENVGLVKSVFVSGEGGDEVTSSLSDVQENASVVQQIRFFYPNINDGKIYFKTKPISFKTNDITKKTLEKAYKEPVENGLGKVLSPNAQINSLYLNKDNMVYVDLNKAFISEMNAGSMYESMILQCIANTFGSYYQAEKVLLTIDGELYESGHIALQKGEYLKVKSEEAVEVQ